MRPRRFLAEISAVVISAVLCAAVSNFLAGRERKLTLPGRYPNALTVPPASPTQPPAPTPGTPAATSPPAVVARELEPIPKAAPRSIRTPRPAASPVSPVPSAPARASGAAEADLIARFRPHPDQVSADISGGDALALHRQGALFLDARRTKVFEEGHVAGARSFAIWEADIDEKVASLLNEGRRLDLPIVVYCAGGECEDSRMLAERLFGVGFANVLVYRDGWPDWQRRGGAVRTGPVP